MSPLFPERLREILRQMNASEGAPATLTSIFEVLCETAKALQEFLGRQVDIKSNSSSDKGTHDYTFIARDADEALFWVSVSTHGFPVTFTVPEDDYPTSYATLDQVEQGLEDLIKAPIFQHRLIAMRKRETPVSSKESMEDAECAFKREYLVECFI